MFQSTPMFLHSLINVKKIFANFQWIRVLAGNGVKKRSDTDSEDPLLFWNIDKCQDTEWKGIHCAEGSSGERSDCKQIGLNYDDIDAPIAFFIATF